MQKKYAVQVRIFPEFPGDRDDGWVQNTHTYKDRISAGRAANRIVCRNGANGVGCDARVVEAE